MPDEDGPAPRSTLAAEAADRLQAILDRLTARRRLPHAVAGVLAADGSTWVGAAGTARPGGEPMRADTPYFIASVTKLYVAAAVLQLHEQGLVGLDGPMVSYLPDELVAGLHRLGGTDHTPRITIRHLLTHASGLPDFIEDGPRRGHSIYDAAIRGVDRSWDLADALRIARELGPRFPRRTCRRTGCGPATPTRASSC